ncbi:MAG TPA: hypothetical protein PK886_00785 [Candidatus Paceibacterota bacterium]|nr:hypothetical protein [Candidatus Paceibacterota bacterium]
MNPELGPNHSENIFTSLKGQLLSGEISPKEFKDKLVEIDQSTPDRANAKENLKLLLDPEIVNFIENQSEDIQKGYYQMLSFTELHIGQIKALYENNPEEALSYFEQSIEHEYKAHAFPENIAYKSAIVAYFKNQPNELEKYIGTDERGNNPKILANMLKGLKERGYPNYKEDYKA